MVRSIVQAIGKVMKKNSSDLTVLWRIRIASAKIFKCLLCNENSSKRIYISSKKIRRVPFTSRFDFVIATFSFVIKSNATILLRSKIATFETLTRQLGTCLLPYTYGRSFSRRKSGYGPQISRGINGEVPASALRASDIKGVDDN
ncbi:hypothetical protein TcasGA2_TC013305 [Tribolium castaneum]|uniref:Uncharacterized protein n=1 Tax=Tribolium castaneum TaxID=7070 RepID=D6WMB5_TRICA|nr:hypothetical protein TcasGA2_TC013305 [Tribolium castaneum]